MNGIMPPFFLGLLLALIFAAVPASRPVRTRLMPALSFAGKRLMRAAIVLLGFAVPLPQILELGPWALLAAILLVPSAFALTWLLGRSLPSEERLLLAAGTSICGASAISAVAAARGIPQQRTLLPTALVTLCGTAAVALLPPLILGAEGFFSSEARAGAFIGAGVHDVGQVVATADVLAAGPRFGAIAVATAVAVKMVRVLMLAPMVLITGRLSARTVPSPSSSQRPQPVPLFVVLFVLAVAARALLPLPEEALLVIHTAQALLLAVALFSLGAALDLRMLLKEGAAYARVAAASWGGVLLLSGAVALTVR